jgi:uncharacterized Ntn-hydrolase superfamily protein
MGGGVVSRMTFSLCVREDYEDDDGESQTRYGVVVTTRLPGVGALCPWASEHGAIATQSRTNPSLGSRGLEYLADGVAVDDALQALLNADGESSHRQVHGVDASTTFTFSGEDCRDWYGHGAGENYTVAGNLLVDESVIEETAAAYEARERVDPLASRLIDALAAGHEAGGDRRTDLDVQSAALVVATTEEQAFEPYYNDLRVDATETPVTDLRETYRLAKRGFEDALEKYAAED